MQLFDCDALIKCSVWSYAWSLMKCFLQEGLNALHIACKTGNLEICQLLLKKAKDQNHFGEKKTFTSDLSILVNAKEKVQLMSLL